MLVTHEDLARADRWFERYGNLAVLMGRLVPVVRTFISLPAGVAEMDLAWFSGLTFSGSFVWSLALVSAGYLLGAEYERVASVLRPLDLPIALVLIALIVAYLYRHLRRREASS